MERISRNDMLLKMAFVAAERGTCSRLQVGAVIAKDGRILTTGYNGAPAGTPHCEHYIWDSRIRGNAPPKWVMDAARDYIDEGGQLRANTGFTKDGPRVSMSYPAGGCDVAEHAERNAIAWAARHGIALLGSWLYCTHAPCLDCARSIVNAGITNVFYVVPYRLTAGVELLQAAGISAFAMSDPR